MTSGSWNHGPGTLPQERAVVLRGAALFSSCFLSFSITYLPNPDSSFFFPWSSSSSPNHLFVYSIILYPLTSSNTTPNTHTHTHTLTESLESRELQILLLSHSPSHLAGHRDVSPPSHLYVTPSTRAWHGIRALVNVYGVIGDTQ